MNAFERKPKSFGHRAAADILNVAVDLYPVQLTKLEYDLLVFLAANPGRALSVDDIMEKVWGYTSGSQEQTVRAQVSRLKRRLDPNGSGHDFITNVRGYGYRFSAPNSAPNRVADDTDE